MRRTCWALLLCVAVVLTSLAIVLPAQAANTKPDNKPTIIVGTMTDWPPWETLQHGQFVGFDIDLVTAIAKRAGFKVVFQGAAWEDLFAQPPFPPYPRFEMVAASVGVTDQRAEAMDFSDIYFPAGMYPDPEAFAFPLGSALVAPVNAGLAQIKADGTYAKIYRQWWGVDPPSIP